MFVEVLRFWLDRGVDGFRVDVAHGLVKEESLRDQAVAEGERPDSESMASAGGSSMVERTLRDEPMWDQPEVHEVYRRWHEVLAEYDGDRMTVAEAWTQTPESMADFVRPDEMSQAFNFAWLLADWSARDFAHVVTGSLEAVGRVGALPTWVLSNHDVPRHVTPLRRRRARPRPCPGGHAGHAGAARLGLPLPGRGARPGAGRRRSGGPPGPVLVPHRRGRPRRLPRADPVERRRAPYGFGPGEGQPWIPQPEGWGPLSVAAQEQDPRSTLAFYRAALAARREHVLGLPDEVTVAVEGEVLHLTRGDLQVLVNCGTDEVPLPAGRAVAASVEVDGGVLPPDAAVWLRG